MAAKTPALYLTIRNEVLCDQHLDGEVKQQLTITPIGVIPPKCAACGSLYGRTVSKGRIREVFVRYSKKGTSTVIPLSPWRPIVHRESLFDA